MQKTLIGIIKRHPDGFGFFIADDPSHPDVYIPRHSMNGVMTNDRVEVEPRPEKGGERFRGTIVRVVQRATTRVTGKIVPLDDKQAVLPDDSHGWGADLFVSLEEAPAVKAHDWVSVEILTYPGSSRGFTGKITKVIGNPQDPQVDAFRVLNQQNVPHEFSREVLRESKNFTREVNERDFQGRQDLRPLSLITIDGATAKDFDDAIYVEMDDQGFHLIVAIADVSHYVKPGTAIDKEAYERGNSTYFPGFVAPMLPEVLSNDLCSLNPRVPRLAMVADMHFDFQGSLSRSRFYEAVMESKARLTYGEAQDIVDGRCPEAFQHVEGVVKTAADLAKVLMAKRFREGSLDMEIPETEIELDDMGQPVDIIRSDRLFSHRLIEEMMLAANVAVALFFTQSQMDTLYRIHEPPDEEDVQALEIFLHNFGFNKKLAGGKLQKKITRALQQFNGKMEETILNILTLRTMKQAKYSPDYVGHFGLGFSDYLHFTSPIRRYPDLIVHRLLKARLMPHKGYRLMGEEELRTAGVHLSACEQRSVKAERQLQAIKKARFMNQFVGQEFAGFISSVTKFGVFVLLRQYDVDGLIRVEDLEGGPFEFDEERLQLVGKKTGLRYSIGDSLQVVVAAAHSDVGQIDFVPVRGNASGGFKTQEPSQKRGSAKKNRQRAGGSRVSRSRRKGQAR